VKVLMICTEKLPVPPIRGGAIQTYIAAISPLLASEHELTILGISDPDLPTQEQVERVTFVRVPGRQLDLYIAGVTEFLGANTFDLIHIFNRPRLVGPVRGAAPSSRIILSMHNDMFQAEKIERDEALLALAELERIVTVSDYVGQTIQRLHPEAEGKVQTIYSGVDLDRFVPSTSSEARRIKEALCLEHGLAGRKVILFVGRLSPKKGADILVRAMPLLARHFPDSALVLVGSKWYGEDRVSDYVAYVRSLATRSPIPVVTTGFVLPEHVHHWFWTGDLFVCPSQWEEPLARVHYEAMATGLPIITTARGGNPEVVRSAGNGLVIDNPESPEAFAEAIEQVLSDPANGRRMGAQGRQLAEAHYGWERVAQEVSAVWQG